MFAISLILGAGLSPVKASPQPSGGLDFLWQLPYPSYPNYYSRAYGEPTPPFVGAVSLVIGVNYPNLLCRIAAARRCPFPLPVCPRLVTALHFAAAPKKKVRQPWLDPPSSFSMLVHQKFYA